MRKIQRMVVYSMEMESALKVVKALGGVKDVIVEVEKGLCDNTFDVVISAPTIMLGASVSFSTYISVFGYTKEDYGTVSFSSSEYLNILM